MRESVMREGEREITNHASTLTYSLPGGRVTRTRTLGLPLYIGTTPATP
jgi:hypothetical protein